MADEDARGRQAIDEALAAVYGAAEPVHFATVVTWSMGGSEPLDGVSAYRRDEPAPHWHYVSYGLTELYDKESDDADTSGWGFELTFRLARGDEMEPPSWPVGLMQNLARYVFKSGNVFEPGHHVDLNGPIAVGRDTSITCALFAADPELAERAGPNGRFSFVQVVGITKDEHDAAQAWNVEAMLEVLRERTPLLVTDLVRRSVLGDPTVRARVDAGTARDGSSSSQVFTTELSWRGTEITVGASVVPQLARALRGRILHDRPFLVIGPTAAVGFEPAASARVSADDRELLRVGCSPALAEELARTLAARAGTYRFEALPDLVVHVSRSEIKDGDGNIVRTIG